MTRRDFLTSSVASSLAAAHSLKAMAPGIRLGYDTYSIRSWGYKALEHLEFAAKNKLDAIQLSSLGDFESLEPAYLAKVKARASELNLLLDAGTGCICPSSKSWNPRNGDPAEHLKKAIRVAQSIGARSVRCYLGDSRDREGPLPIEAHIENTVKVFRGARDVALETGVKIAVENHSGDMQAWETKVLIEAAGKDYVSACLDTGNPIWCAEDPVTTMEVLGPLTATTHVRDTALFAHPRGAAAMWTVVGEGQVDLKRIVEMQRRFCPQAAVHLEIITGRPPRIVPYLEESFWKMYPKARAADLAQFISLVKRGQPLMTGMVIEDVGGKRPEEYAAALKRQQMVDLERSLEASKKLLDLGVAWRS